MEVMNETRTKRLGHFTASEVFRLLAGGRRPMTAEELEAREKGDGRVTVDTLFGEGARTYILEKAAEIITQQPKESPDTYATMWGNAHEKDGVQEFVQRTGIEVEYLGGETPTFFEMGDFAGASPDGLIGELGTLEAKCPFNTVNHIEFLMGAKLNKGQDAGAWLKDHSPQYYAQVQFQMLCTGRDTCHFISYDPRPIEESQRLAIMTIAADEAFMDELSMRVREAVKELKKYIELLTENN